MYAPGDGRVTRRSLLAETLAGTRRRNSLFDSALPLTYAIFACDLPKSFSAQAKLARRLSASLSGLLSERRTYL
jgi:hypothetical protein